MDGTPGVLYEETSGTLLCGDLFTQLGDGPALTGNDIVGPAIAAENLFNYSSLNPGMGATIRRIAKLAPRTLALMHGPSYSGDGAAALGALADDYDRRVLDRVASMKAARSADRELARATHRAMIPIANALAMSMKKAETSGRMMNARAQAPWSLVTAVILAMAVGVAPRLIPVKPAAITAAS